MLHYRFRWTHAIACMLAAAGVAYQSAIIWEMLGDAVTLTVKLGVPLATISAALLPVMAEAAARAGQRGKAFLLTVPVLVLLAFVLPSGISRLGEAQQARIATATLSAEQQAHIRADLAKADKLVTQADAWVATECASGNGPKCRGVTYTLNQRRAYQAELASKVDGLKPVTQPWLPVWHAALLTIGLELSIVAMLFYGFGPMTIDRRHHAGNNVVPFRRPESITEADENTITDDEIAEVKRIYSVSPATLQAARDALAREPGLSNDELAGRIGKSPATASKAASVLAGLGQVERAKLTSGDCRKVSIG